MWTSLMTSARAKRWWMYLLWAGVALTLILALIPAPPKALSTGWDKSDHLGAFGCLAVAARLAWGGGFRRYLLLLACLVAFGGLIEVLQMFVPQRQADWFDLLADTLGTLTGLLLAALVSWMSGLGKASTQAKVSHDRPEQA